MAEWILNQSVREGSLTGLTGGDLMGAKMILIANDIPLTDQTAFADIVVPTFTGYSTSSAITWSDPYVAPDLRLVVAGTHKTFICTGGTPADQIFGAAIVDSTVMDVLAVMRFDEAVPITQVGDGLTVEAVIPYGA